MSCGRRDSVLAALERKYGEAVAGVGLGNGGAMVELYMTPNGSTWTVLVSPSPEVSCLLAAGQNWRVRRPTGPGA